MCSARPSRFTVCVSRTAGLVDLPARSLLSRIPLLGSFSFNRRHTWTLQDFSLQWLGPHSTAADVQCVIDFLQQQGTFRFRRCPMVCSPPRSAMAASMNRPATPTSGWGTHPYRACPLGDWRYRSCGPECASDPRLLSQSRHRFLDIIEGRISASDPMDRRTFGSVATWPS